jgi:hypothetical protein
MNAFRHNTIVHSDLGQIVLNSTNSSRSVNRLKGEKNAQWNKFHEFKKLQSIHKSKDEDYFYSLISEENNRIDSKIMKIIGQMIKPYLELDALLDNMNPQEKAKLLTMTFCSSLLSYNPVKSLHEISEMYRSIQGLNIIAKNWS